MPRQILRCVLCCAVASVLLTACREDPPAPAAPAQPPSIPLYETYVMRLRIPPGRNPFDPDEVTVDVILRHESGGKTVLPAFWFQDYAVSRSETDEVETFTPAGEPSFTARFAPRVRGRYDWRWRLRRGDAVEEKPGGVLVATEPVGEGPVERGSGRYFQRADGSHFFLIGQNIGWSREKMPFTDMLSYLDALADSGQNFCRVWLCTWCFGFEHETMGTYDLARAWQVDRFLEHARRRRICVMLCMENAHDLQTKQSPYWRTDERPSAPVTEKTQFYTHPEARRAFRNRLRYAAARWGHSNALFAWELFNEMEYTLLGPLEMNSAVRDEYFKPWLNEMAAHLKQCDVHGHLVTNSIATDRVWDEMNRFEWMDLAQHHTYLTEWNTDGAGKVLSALEWISGYDKPYLLSEFGGAPAGVYGQEKNVVHETDRAGIHIHNALWASAMSGSAGTAMNWWWDEYIRPNGLYPHYAALSRFLDGGHLVRPASEPLDLSTDAVRVRALRYRFGALLWAQNRAYTWANAGKIETLPPTEPMTVRIDGLESRTYIVQWYDTHAGKVTRTEERNADADGVLEVDLPALQRDIAVRISASPIHRPGR